MKPETLMSIQNLMNLKKIEFADDPKGFAINYDLTDEELRDLVELEYGPTQQDPEKLLGAILRKLVTIAVSHAKEKSDKLSDL